MSPISATARRLGTASAALLTGFVAACSDAVVTAPGGTEPIAAPAFAKAPSVNNTSRVVSQQRVGDTTISVFVVGSAASNAVSFALGNNSQISFPSAAASICDRGTSSYGPTTWDNACTASRSSVQITAKTWLNAQGNAESDFQPAMRFVPTTTKPVMLTLQASPFLALNTTTRIDFRTAVGALVNEGASDMMLKSTATITTSTTLSTSSTASTTDDMSRPADIVRLVVTRAIKHFSGYTVTAD